jgi:hypothetical protein
MRVLNDFWQIKPSLIGSYIARFFLRHVRVKKLANKILTIRLQAVATALQDAQQRNAPPQPIAYGSLTGIHNVRSSA